MQQAEDLMAAAEVTGRSARPLPLFYALSQAGKAVEACGGVQAATRHGLSLVFSDSLLTSKITIHRRGRFQTVADCVGSPLPDSEVTVELIDLIASLPELAGFLPGDTTHPPPPLEIRQDVTLADGGNIVLGSLGDDGQRSWDLVVAVGRRDLLEAGSVSTSWPDCRASSPLLASFYPGGGRLHLMKDFSGGPLQTADGRWAAGFMVHHGEDGIDGFAPEYRDSRWLRPVILPLDEPPAPLMTWWLLAYALSMYARYEPVRWVKALDVDATPEAVLLDVIMREMTLALPALVLKAVSSGGSRRLGACS